ncbi:hypothetical protein P3S67_008647 [Capsicum chacoense]
MPISNHNVNSMTNMQKTEELATPLVVPEVNYVFDPVETIQSDWIEHTSRKRKKYYYNRRTRISTWEKPQKQMIEMERADASTDWREFTSPEGRKYYYNKVTRTSKWRMPDEVKLAREKDIISHASDFGSIPVVKTSSPGADSSLVSAHGAKSSPIAVSPAANLPTILDSESSSLSAVADSEKIGIAATLGNSVAPPVSETTSAQAAVVYGDGFSPENREDVKKDAAITEIGGATPSDEKTEAKSAFKTLLESANIGSDCTWDQAMRAVINDWRYRALKSLGERKQAFNEEHAKALEEQKRNRVEYLEFLKSCDFIKTSSQWRKVQDRLETDERCSHLEKIDRLEIFQEYIRDLESEEEEQRKLWMEELRKAERKNRDEFRKLMEEHVAAGILNAKTNWRDYCINVNFAAYLAVSSNTSGSTAKDLFTDVMDELEKQYLDDKSQIKDAVRMDEIGLTSAWTLDDFKVAIAKYISSPPMSDTNLKFVFEELLERARGERRKRS